MCPVCLNGTGEFKLWEYHMKWEANAKQVGHPLRKIALALRGEFENELQSMTD